jgi:8-oxo-dGTP pyrophosphatase MutT (NUDIX family)
VPIPEFVVALRAKIGHAPLSLSEVTAVVLDDRDRILLVRRADTGRWALTTGCLEPGALQFPLRRGYSDSSNTRRHH